MAALVLARRSIARTRSLGLQRMTAGSSTSLASLGSLGSLSTLSSRPMGFGQLSVAHFSSAPSGGQPSFTVDAAKPGAANLADLSPEALAQLGIQVPEEQPAIISIWPDWLTNSVPVELYTDYLNMLHHSLHMPWWATVIGATITVRLACAPLVINHSRLLNEFQRIGQHIGFIVAVAKADKTWGSLFSMFNNIRIKMGEHGVAPVKFFLLPVATIPLFITFIVSVRKLIMTDPSFTSGGALWFPDLTVADPIYVLPVASIVCTVLSLEIGSGRLQQKLMGASAEAPASTGSGLTNIFQGFIVLLTPLFMEFPSGILLYWITGSICGSAVSALIRRPAFRQRLGMIATPVPLPPKIAAIIQRSQPAGGGSPGPTGPGGIPIVASSRKGKKRRR